MLNYKRLLLVSVLGSLALTSITGYAENTATHLGQQATIKALNNTTWSTKGSDTNTETLKEYSKGILKHPYVMTVGKISFGDINPSYGNGIYKGMEFYVTTGEHVFKDEHGKLLLSLKQDGVDPLVVDSEGYIHMSLLGAQGECFLISHTAGHCFAVGSKHRDHFYVHGFNMTKVKTRKL